jgi:hypothetical protein
MKKLIPSLLLALFFFATVLSAADNALSKSEKADGWKLLFNGKNLNNWKIDKWNPESISVKDGAIKCHGKPSMVYYTGKDKEMKDFHFKADVMTKPGSTEESFSTPNIRTRAGQLDMRHRSIRPKRIPSRQAAYTL